MSDIEEKTDQDTDYTKITLLNKPYRLSSYESLNDFFLEVGYPQGWSEFFSSSPIQEELKEICSELKKIRHIIYPSVDRIFRAFYLTSLDRVKVVLLGMDPYHNGSATGLCFSVKTGNPINPSLRNIYDELSSEGFSPTRDGDLTPWAKQGVLLLNASLTVTESTPDSHTNIWINFTDKLLSHIDQKLGSRCTWILLGQNAQRAASSVKQGRKLIASHPSPYSASNPSKNCPAFIGSGIFKKVQNIIW